MITVTVDKKAIDRQLRMLAKYDKRPLATRAQKAYLAGARLMVAPIRAQIQAAGLIQTRAFYRSVKARSARLRMGEMAASSAGPTDNKRSLLIRGHRIVTRGGRDTGRRTRAYPVMDDAFRDVGEHVKDFINEQVLALGEGFRAL